MDVEPARLLDRWVRLARTESGSYDGEGVRRVGALAARELAAAGCSVSEAVRAKCGAATIVATRSGRDPTLLLLGHLDTVWPRGTLDGFPVVVTDDRISGPGVADMKGGVALLLEALVASQNAPGRRRVVVILTADEELGSPTGSAAINAQAQACDAALVFEPARPGGLFVNERSGLAVFEMTIRGRSAHVGLLSESTVNAIDELARQLLALEALREPGLGISVMVGVVDGGTSRQVIPDHARATVDVRARTQVELDRVMDAVRALALRPHVPGAEIRIAGGQTRPPMMPTITPWLDGVIVGSAAKLGIAVRYTASSGGSDANLAAALGLPTIDGMGPEGFELCSRQEWSPISSGVARARLAADILAGG